MSSFSHRALGVAQLAHETLGLLRGRLTLGDFRGLFRPVVVDCIVCGHVDIRMFYGIDDIEYPVLSNENGLNDDATVLRAAHDAAVRLVTLGRERGGYIPSFALANDQHLNECPHCQKTVCASVRRENLGRRALRSLLAAAGSDASSMRGRLSRKAKQNLRSV